MGGGVQSGADWVRGFVSDCVEVDLEISKPTSALSLKSPWPHCTPPPNAPTQTHSTYAQYSVFW